MYRFLEQLSVKHQPLFGAAPSYGSSGRTEMMQLAAMFLLGAAAAAATKTPNMNGDYYVMHGEDRITMPQYSEQYDGGLEYFVRAQLVCLAVWDAG